MQLLKRAICKSIMWFIKDEVIFLADTRNPNKIFLTYRPMVDDSKFRAEVERVEVVARSGERVRLALIDNK